jgi:ubiquinone/menaquinone biosynthesis C-methylase UbiE
VIDYYEKVALQQRFYPLAKAKTLERLRSRLDGYLLPGRSVLDAGCGAGTWVLERYQDRVGLIAGIDFVAPGRRRWTVFAAADLVQLPLIEKSFDVIVCNDVVEHLERPSDVFRELWRVLVPTGRLVLRTTSLRAPTSWLARATPTWLHRRLKRSLGVAERNVFPTYFKSNTPQSIRRALEEAGFSDIAIETVDETFDYLAFNRLTYVLGLLYSRCVQSWAPGLGNVIIAEGQKRA